jgi:hypothetical protein
MGTAWQGNGMGATWERHGMCELALSGKEMRHLADNNQVQEAWNYCSV